jgi:hypothetical protein
MRNVFLTLALCVLPFAFPQAPQGRYVLAVQYPPELKIKMPFFRTGAVSNDKLDAEGEVRRSKPREKPSVRVEVELKGAPPPSSVKPEYRGYVLWAVTEKAEFVKLGVLDKKVETDTPVLAFGMVISLEPDPDAAQPKGAFVLETGLPDKKTRYFGMTRVYYDEKK